MRSIPQIVKGHGETMEVSFSGCDLGMLENLWHLSHFLMKAMASVFKVGQNIPVVELYGRVIAPSVVTVVPFIDLSKYVVPLFEISTLQEWHGKTSYVELSII